MSEELVVVFYLIIIKKAQGQRAITKSQSQTNDSQGQRAHAPAPWAGVAGARALAGVAGRGVSDRGRCDWSGGRRGWLTPAVRAEGEGTAGGTKWNHLDYYLACILSWPGN